MKVQCWGPEWSEKVGCWVSSRSGWLLELLTELTKTWLSSVGLASSSARVTTSLNNRSDSVSKWEGWTLDNNDKTQVQKTTMPEDKNGTFNRCLWNMIHPWVSPFSLTEGKNSAWFKSNRGWYFRRLSSLSLWSHNFGLCWIIIQILRRVLLYPYLLLSDTMRNN